MILAIYIDKALGMVYSKRILRERSEPFMANVTRKMMMAEMYMCGMCRMMCAQKCGSPSFKAI